MKKRKKIASLFSGMWKTLALIRRTGRKKMKGRNE